jgi:hypothetical protein
MLSSIVVVGGVMTNMLSSIVVVGGVMTSMLSSIAALHHQLLHSRRAC